jgi:hypothetical protein
MKDYDTHDPSQADLLLKAASVEVVWDEYVPKMAREMREAGLPDGEWRVTWSKGDHHDVHVAGDKTCPLGGKCRAALVVYLVNKGVDLILASDLSKCYFATTFAVEENGEQASCHAG